MYRLVALFLFLPALGFIGMVPAPADESRPVLDARQMIVCLAADSSSFEGTLQLFRRDASGQWRADGQPWPVLFCRGGLAWGRGLNPPQPGPQKRGGDHPNPPRLFKIGVVLGYAPPPPARA